MTEPARDNPFWQFSLRVYAAPGVAAECLALQDALDLDVNALLFSAWLGAARRIALTGPDMEAIRTRVDDWHGNVVRPLRQVRRHLKATGYAHSELRARVKAVELEAEQQEQAMLFSWAEQHGAAARLGSEEHFVRSNVRLCLAAYRGGTDASAERLIEAALRLE